MQNRLIHSPEAAPRTASNQAGRDRSAAITPLNIALLLNESIREARVLHESSVHFLEKRRVELEQGAGGDHDLPYQFSLPSSTPQVLAWAKLMARVQPWDFVVTSDGDVGGYVADVFVDTGDDIIKQLGEQGSCNLLQQRLTSNPAPNAPPPLG